MSPEEFAARLAAVPEVQPDEVDLAMIADAEAVNDGSGVFLKKAHTGTSVLDALTGILKGKVPDDINMDDIREERLSRYERTD